MKKYFGMLVRHSKLIKLIKCLEGVGKIIKPTSIIQTGRQSKAVVLHGPRNLKLDYIHERAIQATQVRVGVHFCGLTGSDVLLWRGEHHRIPEPAMVLGFAISGTILEMGGLAHEQTGYQVGEEVVVHNYPACGGLSETCLADYRDVFRLTTRVSPEYAAVLMDDYFSALMAMGCRARIQKDEYFVVNARRSRAALAVIDIATGVFRAKPLAICSDVRRADMCIDLGATVISDTSARCLRYRLKEITGTEEVRLIVETEGAPDSQSIIECLEHDGLIAFFGRARDGCRRSNSYRMPSNYTAFATAVEHYKLADTLLYRETMQQLLDYHSGCVIHPRISAIFGLHRINDAFDYYTTMPSGKVLIDLKDCNRFTLYDSS